MLHEALCAQATLAGGVGNHQLSDQCTLWRTRNTCVVPVGAAATKYLIMHVAYALSFDTTESLWWFHIPLCAHATLAAGWAITKYQIGTFTFS